MRLDPVRSHRINNIWNSGNFTGENRPCARVTIQRVSVKEHLTAHREYRSVLMEQYSRPVELPNLKSIEISRNADGGAATCTVVFYNTKPLAVGQVPEHQDIDQAGYYTFNRGTSPNQWGYESNEWQNFIVPDRFLRTYQGYGQDLAAAPQDDTNLLQTGTWLIDDVDISTDGTITVTCRDLSGMLLDQHIYPPVVPKQHYPLVFQPFPDATTDPRAKTPTRSQVGANYRDYTDIVKQLCSIGGFYWPANYTAFAGEPRPPAGADPALFEAGGRCYGDFETSGTTGVTVLPVSAFDKQTIMDGVTYVKEILGFTFWIAEDGGVIFRSPNIFKPGNYIMDDDASNPTYAAEVLVIDERLHLMSYAVHLSNSNKRSHITVGTADGRIKADIEGFEPIPSDGSHGGAADERPLGLIHQAIWTDQHFESNAECRTMAEMIRLRLKQTYRVGRPRIPANPNLQPDDQVVVVERQTAETYRHYVSGYTSHWDAETGEYTMDLETYWLGLNQAVSYVDTYKLSLATLALLRSTGKIPEAGPITVPAYVGTSAPTTGTTPVGPYTDPVTGTTTGTVPGSVTGGGGTTGGTTTPTYIQISATPVYVTFPATSTPA